MAVVRIRPTGLDEYGDPIAGSADEDEIVGAFTAPRSSTDTEGRARDGSVVGLTLFAPHGSDLARTDLVEVDGVTYRIDGEIADWTSGLTGWRPGITADLARAEG